jgi:hypothetical protein
MGWAASSARKRPALTLAVSRSRSTAAGCTASSVPKTSATKKSSVPLSMPGMKRKIGSAGQVGSIWSQVSAWVKICRTCACVNSVTNSF